MMLLRAENIQKDFNGIQVLNGISLSIETGEFVAVMGRSGCGKSTLLYNISSMDRPSNGSIFFEEKDMMSLSDTELSKIRLEHMGFIFQKSNLLKKLSIWDNIVFPAYQSGRESREVINQRAKEWMERMDIQTIADHDIRKVSGGQLQRAAICRALINQPQILFGDEPTGALNTSATREIKDIFHQINKEGTAILIVTHDAKVAARADRVIYLEDGKVRDQLTLGKFKMEKEEEREKKMAAWLSALNF